jgi:hypothetical protein
MSAKPYSVTTDRTGLSFGYRLGWRLAYMVTFVTGSASRQGMIDPSAQLRRERARKLVTAYRARGGEPPAGALEAAGYQR